MYQLCYEHYTIPQAKPDYIPFIYNADDLHSAVRLLSRLQKNVDRIVYVESTYQEFSSLKSSLREPGRISQIALERKARSFFLEFDIFLDHWQKYISHHSRTKEYKELFDHLTHDAFDSSDNYALATMLRNYVTHSADVIQATFWGENMFDVGCYKDVLLNDSSFSKTKKDIIKRQPAKFMPLSPIMKGALEKLSEAICGLSYCCSAGWRLHSEIQTRCKSALQHGRAC